jgi:hypothetical protein
MHSARAGMQNLFVSCLSAFFALLILRNKNSAGKCRALNPMKLSESPASSAQFLLLSLVPKEFLTFTHIDCFFIPMLMFTTVDGIPIL